MFKRAIFFTTILGLSGTPIAFADITVTAQSSESDGQSMTQYIQGLQEKVHSEEDAATLQAREQEEINEQNALKVNNPVLPPNLPGNIKKAPPLNTSPPNPYVAPNPWSDTTSNPWAPPNSPGAVTHPGGGVIATPPTAVPNIFGPNTTTTTNNTKQQNNTRQQQQQQQPTIPGNIYQ